jgi:hypothetical protein
VAGFIRGQGHVTCTGLHRCTGACFCWRRSLSPDGGSASWFPWARLPTQCIRMWIAERFIKYLVGSYTHDPSALSMAW